ncbi:MAG: T9SS type A sorting domain-containing protein [Bacteroidetes bacterium]|nr:T9SS type A sorting domain-containing protein [Bacteroidota bacterium]
MKKFTILFVMTVFSAFVFGQSAQKEADLQNLIPQMRSDHTIYQDVDLSLKGILASLNESFDMFPPNGWTVDPETGYWEGSGTWYYSQYASNFGDGVFAVMDVFNISAGEEGTLITPVLHPVAGDNTLSYDVIEILLNGSYIATGIELYIEFSTDGGSTWTTSTTNVLLNVPDHNTASAPQTPTTLSADLSAYNDGAVQVRFRCVSDYGGFSMFLDNVTGPEADISVLTNELVLTDAYLDVAGLGYYAVIPISQFVGVTINGAVGNLGSADQTNVVFHADDPGNGINLSSTPQSVTAGSADTLAIDITAPATSIVYSFGTEVTQNESDEVPANNVGDSIQFAADPVYYSRAGVLNTILTSYSFGASAPAVTGMEYGANYHFAADATIDSISVLIYGASGTGTVVGRLYSYDPLTGVRTLLGETAQYTPSGAPEYANLALTSPIDFTLGEIVTATVQLNVNVAANDTISIGSDGSFPGDAALGGAAYLQVGGTFGWYSVVGTVPLVALILDVATSIENPVVNENIIIFPNPTQGIVTITGAENANIVVYNIVGDVVMNVNNVNRVLDLSGLANGTYIIKVQAEDGVSTQKINLIK